MEMKEELAGEYISQVGKVLGSNLNGGNVIKGINIRPVSRLRYSAAFLHRNTSELAKLD